LKSHRVSTASCAFGLLLIITSIADAQSKKPSAVACDRYAQDYGQRASARGQMLGGAAKGSLLGLGIGAIAGASGVGAAVGAGVGLIGGGARRHADSQRLYNAAYQDCMSGRIN
jgi:hypothetical protein